MIVTLFGLLSTAWIGEVVYIEQTQKTMYFSSIHLLFSFVESKTNYNGFQRNVCLSLLCMSGIDASNCVNRCNTIRAVQWFQRLRTILTYFTRSHWINASNTLIRSIPFRRCAYIFPTRSTSCAPPIHLCSSHSFARASSAERLWGAGLGFLFYFKCIINK